MADIRENIQKEAIKLVTDEKNRWDAGSAFITEKISFEMREAIRRARRNYYGIYEKPKDENTGIEKIWVPLTEWTVETYVKNIDLDTKDINIRSLFPTEFAYLLTQVVKQIVQNALKRLRFGEILDDGQRALAIDGTWVQKSYKGFDNELRRQALKTARVDLLNFWIDPAATDIQSAPSVIERAIMTSDEVARYRDVWLNLDAIIYQTNLSPAGGLAADETRSLAPAIDVYERWGKMPKYLLTGEAADRKVLVDGVIIASGIDGKNALVHKIWETRSPRKPYEEAWLRRVPGRWYGRGVGEQLFDLQEYVNEVVNIRQNNNRLLQNRLFEIRRGAGITPQQLAKLVAGGGITVTELGRDIREFPVSDMRASSYKDEEVVYQMANRATGAFEVSRGETLPASTPATNAFLQNQNARSTYTLVQEGLGMFLKRLIEKHWLPVVLEVLQDEEIIEILGGAEEMRVFDDTVVQRLLDQWSWSMLIETGFIPDETVISAQREKLKGQLVKQGKSRFVKSRKALLRAVDYAVDVYVTNEEFDKATLVQNLNQMLVAYSKMGESALDVDMVIREVLNVLGLNDTRFFKKTKEKVAGASTPAVLPEVPGGAAQPPLAPLVATP